MNEESQRSDPAARAAMERALARVKAGQPMPTTARLPDEKSGFPKLLCLDMNHWIYLARAHYGLKDGEPHRGALEAIVVATASGKLVVPIMSANFIEVAETRDDGRRQRLAQFMVDLSGNQSLVSHEVTRRAELRRAVRSEYLQQQPSPVPRSFLVRWGIDAALGREAAPESDAASQVLTQARHEPEMSVRFIVDVMTTDTVEENRQLDREAQRRVSLIRQIDQGLDTDEKRYREAKNLMAGGALADVLKRVEDDLGLRGDGLRAWLAVRENVCRFADAVPFIDVMATIMIARDRSRDEPTGVNDGKDFTFLEVAIPYANLVATEKRWANLARSTKLDRKYDTIVVGKLRDLPQALQRAGCI